MLSEDPEESPEPAEAAREPEAPPKRHMVPVVGIGASAGGLEAFSTLVANLPAEAGMAYVLVPHLDPTHESWLTDLLQRRSHLPVRQITQDEKLLPDTVYVLPPNANVAVYDGNLRLLPRPTDRAVNLPIDLFFRSLASEHGERTVGVVLSGTGSDGTLGAVEIKAMGGIVIAQEPGTAEHPGMPQSVIDSGAADFVLAPEQIGAKLAELASHPYLGERPARQAPAVAPTAEDAEAAYSRILSRVRSVTSVDFHHYRDTTIRRRILRRLALHSHRSLQEYADFLERDPSEVEALHRDLLINVTSFFRDPEMFEALKTLAFPEILRGKTSTTPIRIWVPGCSTGQEAYSLVMALLEYLDDKPIRPPIQVFATDLSDPASLDKARAGLYPESIEADVSPARLRRFFRKEDHLYRVDKAVRDACVFARQNVPADPPFSHVDLISCRNVLIYMSPVLQKRVVPTFHYALNQPGYLVLGSSESVGEFTDLFEVADRVHRIYAKRSSAGRTVHAFFPSDLRGVIPVPGARRASPPAPNLGDYQREADRLLLSRYAPAGVLVNEHFEILQFRGRTAPFLEMPPGEPTSNLFRLASEGLFLDLRSAVNEAALRKEPVTREGVRLRRQDGVRTVNLTVMPVRPAGGGGNLFLILFEDVTETETRQEVPATDAGNGESAQPTVELEALRHELAATKEYLQSLVEQQDAVNEELRSANEEILSSNEELQSTNEELETAKEELQSTNEELTTVNEQLSHRNQELSQLTNDLTNLLSSTNIPVVMVGSDLRIRRITAPALKIMSLLPSDVGRPLSDLRTTPELPDLEQTLLEVMEEVRVREFEVRDRYGHWYLLRLSPYRTSDHRIDGVVLVLLDIDQLKRNAEELKAQAVKLQQQATFIDLTTDAITVRDANNLLQSWNRGAEALYGWSEAEARGQNMDLLLQCGPPAVLAERNRKLATEERWEGVMQVVTRDGRTLPILSRQVCLRDEGGVVAFLALSRPADDD
jgi:two-component system CheB/CheR fusion protein